MARGTTGSRAELVISLGVLLLGIGATIVAWRLPEAGGYARIGPNVMPKIVSAGMILLGIWLLLKYSPVATALACPTIRPSAASTHSCGARLRGSAPD